MATLSICSVADCGKPSRRAGYCSAHHHRALRYGNPLGGGALRVRAHDTICSVDGCHRPYYGRGYCQRHWQRWEAHGDPKAGRTERGSVPEYIETVILAHTGDDCLIWPFARTDTGYGQLAIGGKKHKASRYVCARVHGEPPTPTHESAHSCGNGHLGCVSPRHLSWKTPSENSADKYLHGTHLLGERNHSAKLTNQQVREIRAMSDEYSDAAIGRMFSVRGSTIGKIRRRERWAHVL